MTSRLRSTLLAVVLACAAAPACDVFMGPSKVAHGQLYQSGDAHYDAYFNDVHQQQVAAANWDDDRKAAERPIVTALALTPGASEDTILDATRERAKKHGGPDPALSGPVEETKRLELDRARKLRAMADRLNQMVERGKTLKEEADKTYANRGADKADEKKSDKQREVRRELGAAVSVCGSLARDATNEAKDAEEFADDLAQANEAKDTPKRHRSRSKPSSAAPEGQSAPPPPPTEPKPEPPPPEKKPEAKKPAPKKPAKPAEKKPAEKKPAEKPGDSGEVFNP